LVFNVVVEEFVDELSGVVADGSVDDVPDEPLGVVGTSCFTPDPGDGMVAGIGCGAWATGAGAGVACWGAGAGAGSGRLFTGVVT
jgi:hypothetical protein